MSVISVDHVSMRFEMINDRISSIKEYAMALVHGKIQKKEFWALKDVSFDVQKGEVVGIIGRNGAGKSTTLKILSGILTPTSGSVHVEGNIVPMLELGSGFDYDLSGRENIFLNGAILGYSKEFLEEKYQEILDFSELGEFINIPIRNYSSGMLMRLAFSIATVVEPEVLIVDEILAVGDENFQKKSKARMMELMSGGTTVLFVSHSLDQIREMCDRVVWIEGGVTKMFGPAKEVCDAYNITAPEVGREIRDVDETAQEAVAPVLPQEDPNDPRAFRDLGIMQFDQFHRYETARFVLESLRRHDPSEHLKLLECGADDCKRFQTMVPMDRLFYIARRLPDPLKGKDEYLEADPSSMPEIPDDSFDVVISLDDLNDIPREYRPSYVKELFRVSRKGLILAFPFECVENHRMEEELSAYYREVYGYEYYWFQLHAKRGLPEREQIEKTVTAIGCPFFTFEHADTHVTQCMLEAQFLFEYYRNGLQEKMAEVTEYYETSVFPADRSEKNYRVFFFLGKDKDITEAVHKDVLSFLQREEATKGANISRLLDLVGQVKEKAALFNSRKEGI